jgi:hypothetical protein
MGVIETARDIARQYFDKQSLGRGANYCTSTEAIHGKAAASPSEWSLAAYSRVAAPHKVAVPSGGPLLDHKRNVEDQLQYRTTGVPQMNSDEVNWLLQTIQDPENAKHFVQAQYQRGRIPYQVMTSLARDRNWTDWPAAERRIYSANLRAGRSSGRLLLFSPHAA